MFYKISEKKYILYEFIMVLSLDSFSRSDILQESMVAANAANISKLLESFDSFRA